MRTPGKRILISCIIAIFYFITIYVPVAIYYRTSGSPPDFLVALHFEFVILPLFAMLIGIDFYRLSAAGQEIFAFIAGLIFYIGLGTLLGFLSLQMRKRKYSRGLFYAILCCMVGYTIGALVGGHPPAFIFIAPPLFFIGGYFYGVVTFENRKENAMLYDEEKK